MATVQSQVVEQDSLRGAMLEFLTEGKQFVLITVDFEEHDGVPGVATAIESSITDAKVVESVLVVALEALDQITK